MNLLPIASIVPSEYRSIFGSFDTFNSMQSIVAEELMHSDDNCVICSPPGSGKTVLHELAIVRLLSKSISPKSIKCVLITPNKALCQQRSTEWVNLFEKFGVK